MRFDPKVPNNRRRVVVGALIAFVVGGVLAFLGLRGGDRELESERPTATLGAASTTVATAPDPEPPPSAPSAAATPPSSAAPSASARVLSNPQIESTATAKASVTPGPKPPPIKGPDCDPPYTVTPQGVRRYKVECL
jgi:hypothetical protein